MVDDLTEPAASRVELPPEGGAGTQVSQPAAAASDAIPALTTFVVLTFGFSWGLAGIATLATPTAPVLGEALMILCGFGPSLAAVLIVLLWDGRAGVLTWVRRCLIWRENIGWYLLAFAGPPFAMLAALGLHVLLGGALPASPASGNPGLTLSTFEHDA